MTAKLQYMLPQQALSKLAGFLASSNWGWLKNYLISYFINKYPNIALEEAIIEDYKAYPNFNAFFGRHLKTELRPISNNIKALASPVDGTILDLGAITSERKITAKGHDFTLQSLLGEESQFAQFMTIYLAPHNYHRIHMPFTGKLTRMRYIPGKLFSVNPNILNTIPEVLAMNERVVLWFATTEGEIALVLVGAMIVGSIVTNWAGRINTGGVIQNYYYETPLEFNKGQELARFELGSTVIMLLPNNITLQLEAEQTVCYGQEVGTFN